MKITPYNILKHEIIGLEAEVVESRHEGYKGIKGLVVDETMNTIVILTSKGYKRLPKAVSKFKIRLPEGTHVIVDGAYLIGRPEDRLKKVVKRW